MMRRTRRVLLAIVAVGTSSVVLLQAEKPRRFVQARLEQLRHILPQRMQRSAQYITLRIPDLSTDAERTTGQAMRQVKPTAMHLAERAKELTAAGNQQGC